MAGLGRLIGITRTLPYEGIDSYYIDFVCALAAVLSSHSAWAGPADCECPDIAIKTNLVHDAILTPDLGIEVVLPANFRSR